MKHFEQSRTRLSGLSFHARLVYSIFTAFILIGLAETMWLAYDMVGFQTDQIVHYYGGGYETPQASTNTAVEFDSLIPDTTNSGPVLELPEDVDSFQQAPAMSQRKLLELTHFHLFSLPVVLLILSHLYMLSSASPKSKTVWILLSSFASATHIAAPWIAAKMPSFFAAWLYGISGTVMLGGMTVMAFVPLIDMWWPRMQANSSKS